jgi:hypothetical protein
LEKARQQSLQKALDKNMRNAGMTRGEEISSIQEQLEHKNCSAAAAVGLKKRLAALKASALREERKRISSSTSQVDVSSPAERERVERAHSASGLGIEESSGALAAASMSIDAVSPAGTPTNMKSNDDLWPEPAKPPPRNSLPAPCRASAEIPFGLVESPPPTRVVQVGVDGRPWHVKLVQHRLRGPMPSQTKWRHKVEVTDVIKLCQTFLRMLLDAGVIVLSCDSRVYVLKRSYSASFGMRVFSCHPRCEL